ncbi:MAG: hypothetical protein K2M76_04960, partial [Muribaculaceae bacterium]|nr:hypothetical protein [Muribaculaceae bacterium]
MKKTLTNLMKRPLTVLLTITSYILLCSMSECRDPEPIDVDIIGIQIEPCNFDSNDLSNPW